MIFYGVQSMDPTYEFKWMADSFDDKIEEGIYW